MYHRSKGMSMIVYSIETADCCKGIRLTLKGIYATFSLSMNEYYGILEF